MSRKLASLNPSMLTSDRKLKNLWNKLSRIWNHYYSCLLGGSFLDSAPEFRSGMHLLVYIAYLLRRIQAFPK